MLGDQTSRNFHTSHCKYIDVCICDDFLTMRKNYIHYRINKFKGTFNPNVISISDYLFKEVK